MGTLTLVTGGSLNGRHRKVSEIVAKGPRTVVPVANLAEAFRTLDGNMDAVMIVSLGDHKLEVAQADA